MHNLGGLIVVMIVLAFAASLVKDGPRRGAIKVQAKPLMTPREVAFWRLLCVAAEPFHVAPQVAMGALLSVPGGAGSRGARNRFDRKIVDFVLLNDGGTVQLLIELDDRMHRADRDAARDRLTASAGYRTLRIQGVVARDLHLLRAEIAGALGTAPSWSPPMFDATRRRQRL